MALFSPFENLFPLFVFTVAPFKHDPPNPKPTNFVYILTSTAEIVRYAWFVYIEREICLFRTL